MRKRKLVLLSYAYPPSIGGIERASEIIGRTFLERGYDVTVITETPNNSEEGGSSPRIVRNPGIKALISELHSADVVLQNNISLRLAWPLWLLFPWKPFVLLHNTPITRPDGSLALQDRIKRGLLWRPRCFSVSRYIADTMPPGSGIIGNPFDSSVFRMVPGTERSRDLLFVGRLVTAKGAEDLLRAFAIVLKRRPQTTLSIIGSGAEEERLHDLANLLGVSRRAQFLGPRGGHDVAEAMNQHKLLVVPSRSRPPEALGIVALEGIACGCIPVASRMGGLPECVGEAGALFEEGNYEELAEMLICLLNSPELVESYRAKAEEHLTRYRPEAIADAFEANFGARPRR
jgi:glycogen synthase